MKSVQLLEEQLALLPAAPLSADRIDALNDLAWEIGLNQTRRSYEMAREALDLARRLAYPKGAAYANRTIAYCYLFYNRMRESIDLARKTLGEFQAMGEIMGEATTLDILSTGYSLIGSYDQALQESLKSLTINRLIKYRRGEAWALNNIGQIWFDVGDFEQALRNFQSSIETFRAIPYPPGESSVLLKIGKVHEQARHYEQALNVLHEGSRIAEAASVPYFINRSYSDLGRVYRKLGDGQRALFYFRKSLQSDGNRESPALTVETLLDLADLFREWGQDERARRVLLRALRRLGDGGMRAAEYRAHEGLSIVYERKGDFQKALEHERRYHQVRELVHNEEAGTKIRNMQTRLEVEKAETEAEIFRLRSVELKELNQRLEIQTRELDRTLHQLNEDLRMARDIQQKILPPLNLELAGLSYHYEYRPIDQVGGDFLDIAEIRPGLVRIFMADAVGHGVQASLITMALKSEYEELKPAFDCPSELVRELNRRIRRKYRRLIAYIPAILVDLHVPESRLRYCSAGMLDQLVLRGNGGVERLTYSGPSLGMLDEPAVVRREISFASADRLFLFSDGLTESFNRDDELFGEERVVDLLRRSENESLPCTLDRLLVALGEFRATGRPQDDVTLIGVRAER